LEKEMKICEVFTSISGEAGSQGKPATFIRTFGCNLDCWKAFGGCDTPYSKEPVSLEAEKRYFEITPQSLVQDVVTTWPRLVVITGGEPLLQGLELVVLSRLLTQRGHKVLIETNGSLDVSALQTFAVIDMDVKLPSSGMYEEMYLENISFLRTFDELKFVIKTREDFETAVEILDKFKPICKIYMSPYWDEEGRDKSFATLAYWILEEHLDVTYSIQLHKCIWNPRKRGV